MMMLRMSMLSTFITFLNPVLDHHIINSIGGYKIYKIGTMVVAVVDRQVVEGLFSLFFFFSCNIKILPFCRFNAWIIRANRHDALHTPLFHHQKHHNVIETNTDYFADNDLSSCTMWLKNLWITL